MNLAGVISESARARLLPGWPAVLEFAQASNPDLALALERLAAGPRGFLGTGPVFFTEKPAVERGLLMAGDAAGVIDPFSGEGQAAALASGILAGETAARLLRGELAARDYLKTYRQAWRRRFARRFAWSAFFRRMILNPTLGGTARRIAGQRLVRLAIAALR